MITLIPQDTPSPIWEFTHTLPDYIHEYLADDNNWIVANQLDGQILAHDEKRHIVKPGVDALHYFASSDLVELQSRIIEQIFNPEQQLRNEITVLWPDGVSLEASYQIVRDAPGHYMAPHIDNRNSFAAIILNLSENDDGTTVRWGEQTYTGPTGIGSGVVIMNTHNSLHEIRNSSNRHRYAALMNLKLKMDQGSLKKFD